VVVVAATEQEEAQVGLGKHHGLLIPLRTGSTRRILRTPCGRLDLTCATAREQ